MTTAAVPPSHSFPQSLCLSPKSNLDHPNKINILKFKCQRSEGGGGLYALTISSEALLRFNGSPS